ncbi:cytochrome P450 4B1-like [Glandiceps talaboti]
MDKTWTNIIATWLQWLHANGIAVIIYSTFILVIINFTSYLFKQLSNRRLLEKIFEDFPGEPKHWLLGHLPELDTTLESFQKKTEWASKRKYGIPIWYGPFLASFECSYPESMKAIYSTAEPKDEFTYGLFKPWLGDGLLISKGAKWSRNRKLLTPGFHFDVLKPYAKIFSGCAHTLVEKWCKMSESKESIEMFHHVSLLTLDCLVKCIFSVDIKCQTIESDAQNPYTKSIYDVMKLIEQRFFNILHHNNLVYYFTSNGRKFRRTVNDLHSFSKKVIKQRREALVLETEKGLKNNRKYIDFLDILLSAKDEDGNGLTDQEIRDEVDTFMFEGHDTTASGISWCLYNLAKNPEHQRKCQEELDEFFERKGSLDLEWNDLHSFPYLTMSIKESLRVRPPVPVVGRKLSKPMFFPDGRSLPAGTWITMNMYALHHNAHVWENPEKFDPLRFLPENVEKRSPYAFLPFAAGPRNCIGQNFAMSEMKITIALLLHHLEFSIDESKPVKGKNILVFRTVDGMYLYLKKRKSKT